MEETQDKSLASGYELGLEGAAEGTKSAAGKEKRASRAACKTPWDPERPEGTEVATDDSELGLALKDANLVHFPGKDGVQTWGAAGGQGPVPGSGSAFPTRKPQTQEPPGATLPRRTQLIAGAGSPLPGSPHPTWRVPSPPGSARFLPRRRARAPRTPLYPPRPPSAARSAGGTGRKAGWAPPSGRG